jgi:hypothetical protein
MFLFANCSSEYLYIKVLAASWVLRQTTTIVRHLQHYWQNYSNLRSLYFFLASTTALALLDGVPKEVVAGVGAVSTMLAAAASFLKSSDRRQLHEKTSKGFRSLMVKMISCESEKDYEKYWADFNREIMDEPIMLKKFTKNFKMKYTMTPELREVKRKLRNTYNFLLAEERKEQKMFFHTQLGPRLIRWCGSSKHILLLLPPLLDLPPTHHA